MQLNLCLPNTCHASKDTKGISFFDNQTPSIPTRTQNVTQLLFKNPSHVSEDTNCTSICDDPFVFPFMGRQKCISVVLTKSVPCQREHKMHLNLC